MNLFNGTAAKFLVAVSGAISTALTVFYGTARWEPAALAGLSAVMVYLVPNKSIVGDVVPAPTPTNSGSV
jgi:hypothetical protein